MDERVGAAARLPGSERGELAIQALAGSETVTDLATRHGVSRKFVYRQTHRASTALNDPFASDTPDGAVLFELVVTKAWVSFSPGERDPGRLTTASYQPPWSLTRM